MPQMRETAVLAVTFFSALFPELEFAIFAGVLLSLVLYLDRTSKPRIVTLAPDPRLPDRTFSSKPNLQCPRLRIYPPYILRLPVNHVEQTFDRLRADYSEQRHLAVVASGINFVALQGGTALAKEAKQRKAAGGGFYFIDVKRGVREPLARCDCMDAEAARNVFRSKDAAIHGIDQKLDKSICETCERRIFTECGRRVGNQPLSGTAHRYR